MMYELTAAIYSRLVGDATLTGMLASYREMPAVFTQDPAPDDAELPYLVSAGDVADSADDTKTTRGRRVWRDVRCYAERNGDPEMVETIAERVRTLLHRHALTVDGYRTVIAEATGPVAADEDDAYGRIVTVQLRMERT